ncbi:hypothetical protein CBM2586_A10401 [Cupriavidus phytorum]|uniref:Uncharacterized protein n=1 Tax=Cupriavidus taiwanensis TaxID=164546 RepID=A0A375B9U4_9BURK|nr:hypothetical protein CBM2586_A10401 [Cupriavidus taiwanensis]
MHGPDAPQQSGTDPIRPALLLRQPEVARGVPAAGLAATPHCQPDTDSLSARAALQ